MTTSNTGRQSSGAQSSIPKVVVIVLTWNGKSLTLDCLESLDGLKYGNIEVVVVDNASTDGTATTIEEQYGNRVTTLVNETNLGFSGGNNVGIRYALERGADYILLLNNDTLVDPGLVDHLVDVISKTPEIGVVGPKIYYASP
ncbi:MAG: glycosyltransferase family 2 protein, partial [Candidatus Latescibacterota bacterium]